MVMDCRVESAKVDVKGTSAVRRPPAAFGFGPGPLQRDLAAALPKDKKMHLCY